MKVLVCTESEILSAVAVHALFAGGHEVVAEGRPEPLIPEAEAAGALLVSPSLAKAAVRLLREQGFEGRALLFSDEPQERLDALVAELDADGAVTASPIEALSDRFLAALRQRRRVLIVDDSELAAELLGAELSPKGFEVHYASNAEAATQLILKRPTRPDLILLDINMPDVDGEQFCRFLKQNQLFRGIKVILCSGEERERVEAVAEACGADGFILKDEFLGRWVTEQVG
jgi:CheY-like chemotaxis protein